MFDLQLFKCGFGLGFWVGFYAFDDFFNFEVFRHSFLPVPSFLVCLLVKAATGEERKKNALTKMQSLALLIYRNAK